MSDPNPLETPKPPVVQVNRKPLAIGMMILLTILMVGTQFLKPSKTVQAEPPAPPQDNAALTEAFIREQQARAARPAARPPAPRPTVLPQAPPASSPDAALYAPPAAAADLHLEPGTYSPNWGRSGAQSPPTARSAAPPGEQERPAVRFREGQDLQASAQAPSLERQFSDALRQVLPSTSTSEPAAPARTPDARSKEFLQAGQASAPYILQADPPPGTPYVLFQGTLIPATLETALSSELPGQVTALVRRDVFDSPTGLHLLLPQGSRLIGEYTSDIVYGERRLLVAWTRAILPSGLSFSLLRMPGTDALGAAGLTGRVNNHWLKTVGTALLLTSVSAAAQLSQPASPNLSRNPSASEVAAGALGQQLGDVSTQTLKRDLDLRPTLTARPGTLFSVAVTRDIIFPAPYRRP
jgi:type IV secretion system protein TrbI